jgi:hypothetical protein
MSQTEFKPVPSAKRLTLLNTSKLQDYGVELYQIPGEFRIGLAGEMPEHCRWLYSGTYNEDGALFWRHYTSTRCLIAGYESVALARKYSKLQLLTMLQTDADLVKDYAHDINMPLNMSEMVAAARLLPITELDRVLEIYARLGLEQLHLLAHHPEQWVQTHPEAAGLPHEVLMRMHGFGLGAPYLAG